MSHIIQVGEESTPRIQPKAVVFCDGQNLFHEAQRAFGYDYPNFDIALLAKIVGQRQSWEINKIRFYTGIPGPGDDPFWNTFWQNKLCAMSRKGVETFSRPLRYRTETIVLPDRTTHTHRYAQEKGIDVRIAIDAIRGALRGEYDVAVFFSLDQDLSEVAKDIRTMTGPSGVPITVASAFPCVTGVGGPTPIGNTMGIRIDQTTYDQCIDPRDYRPIQRTR